MMSDIDLLYQYLQRRFKGQVTRFIPRMNCISPGIPVADAHKWDISIRAKSRNVHILVETGLIGIWWNKNYGTWHKEELHLADQDFETKVVVLLTDKAGLKLSKLKADN